eukprot:1342510-Amorphochlora_amoeboformis.AAC.1
MSPEQRIAAERKMSVPRSGQYETLCGMMESIFKAKDARSLSSSAKTGLYRCFARQLKAISAVVTMSNLKASMDRARLVEAYGEKCAVAIEKITSSAFSVDWAYLNANSSKQESKHSHRPSMIDKAWEMRKAMSSPSKNFSKSGPVRTIFSQAKQQSASPPPLS